VQGEGLGRRWLAGLAAKRAGSEPLQAKWCAARAFRCIAVQGEGVVVFAARCRAGVREQRCRRGSVCVGT
jgi:hypothetical protein